MHTIKVQIVIPARLASTRLPRKLLLAETGKPLIQHTYESASRAKLPGGICVATDHEEILRAVQAFDGKAEMTDPRAASGTDRVAEVARRMGDAEIIVNVQGDEPEIAGSSIDLAVEMLQSHPEAVMLTLATPIRSRRQFEDPACVKVVFDEQGRALYFSRSPIPMRANGTMRCSLPIRRTSISTSGSMPTAASSSSSWPPCRHRAWSKSRNSSSFASCKPATRSSSV